MKINDAGVSLIREFEGWSAVPYLCPGKVWTIGYGSTRLPDDRPVAADTCPITEAEATEWMRDDLYVFERDVTRLITVRLTENQFSALVSFTYNLGSGNLKASTLRSKLNREDYDGAANEFKKWKYAGGRVWRGLVRRRAAERALFVTCCS